VDFEIIKFRSYRYMCMYMHVDFRNVKLRLSECAVILLVEIGSVGITFTKVTLVFGEYILKEYNVLETICELRDKVIISEPWWRFADSVLSVCI
jgi:hypothetical protein